MVFKSMNFKEAGIQTDTLFLFLFSEQKYVRSSARQYFTYLYNTCISFKVYFHREIVGTL